MASYKDWLQEQIEREVAAHLDEVVENYEHDISEAELGEMIQKAVERYINVCL